MGPAFAPTGRGLDHAVGLVLFACSEFEHARIAPRDGGGRWLQLVVEWDGSLLSSVVAGRRRPGGVLFVVLGIILRLLAAQEE